MRYDTETKDEAILRRLESCIASDIPGFKQEVKEESRLMRAISRLFALFNTRFLHEYVTTIYPKVYSPRSYRMFPSAGWKMLAHEWIHLHRAKKLTPFLHGFLFLFPQILAPLSLISIVAIWSSNWWLLNLAWLVCIAPLPSRFRAEDEFRGYTMSMAVEYWRYGTIPEKRIQEFSQMFTSSEYYYMWPFKTSVKNRLAKETRKIREGKYDKVFPYSEVKTLIEQTWHQKNV